MWRTQLTPGGANGECKVAGEVPSAASERHAKAVKRKLMKVEGSVGKQGHVGGRWRRKLARMVN